MILSLQRQMHLRAFLEQVGDDEAAKRCDCPVSVLYTARDGGEVDLWTFDNITEALEAWDAGKEGIV